MRNIHTQSWLCLNLMSTAAIGPEPATPMNKSGNTCDIIIIILLLWPLKRALWVLPLSPAAPASLFQCPCTAVPTAPVGQLASAVVFTPCTTLLSWHPAGCATPWPSCDPMYWPYLHSLHVLGFPLQRCWCCTTVKRFLWHCRVAGKL